MKSESKKSRLVLGYSAVTFLLGAGSASAEGPFLITNRSASNPVIEAAFNSIADELVTSVNSSIFTENNQALFADGMAGANSSGNTAVIADRASEPTLVSVTGGAQINVFGVNSLASVSFANTNSLPSVGAGVHAAATVGVRPGLFGLGKLGPIDLSRLKIYATFLSMDLSLGSSASFAASAYGLNLQYKVVPSVGMSFLAKWGGIDFLTGVNYISNRVGYSGTLTQSQTSGTSTMSFDFDYNLGVQSKVTYIPLEVSTSAQVLYLFTVYGGAAADLNFGSSGLTGGGSGDVTATENLSASGYTAEAVLDFDTYGYKAKPSLVNTRGFVGGQLNLSLIKIGGEATFATSGNTSIGFYGRIVF